jgi:alpha-tubulin suppressor-like RCC1 family protein
LQVPFPVGVKVVDVACGELHAIALSAEGVCFAWGRNTKAALVDLHFHTITELTFSAAVLDCLNRRPMRAR